jgi:exodeoxyribonuclease-3
MKLMSYNILDGGLDRISLIIDAVKKEVPDFLTINEANTFAKDDKKIMNQMAQVSGLPYFAIAMSGEYDYHAAVFSKYPFKKMHIVPSLMRACIITLVETEIGEVSIASFHLTPYSEDLRHPEIDKIIDYQKQYPSRILIGDMNSLAESDDYNPDIVNNFNNVQLKKFTTDKKLRFDVINKITSSGYIDTAKQLEKHKDKTVPTPANRDASHAQMRLDYIFISNSLLPHLHSYAVVKNEITDRASDHYPITVVLK